MVRKVLLGVLVVIIIMQFIRPARNESTAATPNDIANVYAVPEDVSVILKRACYDCHSNNTRYPWYTNIQPGGLWMQHHVDDGKEELNFNEFATYKKKRQAHKMEEVAEMVEKGEMPLSSYTWIHKDAILTAAEKELLINWAKGLEQLIKPQITQ